MRKYKLQIILVVAVAAMYSCNGDIYDNIKEMVDKETVYPAGYDPRYVKAAGGLERVEIDLCEKRFTESELYLPKAVRTVVEYSGKKDVFEPARSWVNITGLTVPQVYRFKIYTEDEFGNASRPVEITGKPFTEADKGALVVLNTVSASASQAAVVCAAAPDMYTFCYASYSYTDKNNVALSGKASTPVFILNNLGTGKTTQVNISYHLLPKGAIDTVLVADVLEVKTITQQAFDDFLNETSPFKGPHIVSAAAPCTIPGWDFDYGGEGKAFHDSDNVGSAGADGLYRVNNGDPESVAVDIYDGYPCIGWCAAGEWLVYTVEVADEGIYSIETAHGGAGKHHIEIDRLNISGTVSTSSGGNPNYAWSVSVPQVSLTAGKHKIKYYIETGVNYYGIKITYKN
ncbi:hypothetical protein AGMMS50239_38520 [Bacteroidia bacterium]|nr:hypothetical protein AGMMS50239_38520 [Bacteroidia bacterium]